MEIIIGAGISLLMQLVKGQMRLGEYGTLIVLFIVSITCAAIYQALIHTGFWDITYEILVTAGAFYTFIVQRFTKGSTIAKALGNT